MNLRELVAVLAHEMRTPLAAILGYQELLTEGIYGELDTRQREPVERIQRAAEQILSLVDGLQALAATDTSSGDERTDTDTGAIARSLSDRLRPLAHGYDAKLEIEHQPLAHIFQFPLSRFLRAAEIAIIAAIKSSPGRSLRLACWLTDGQVVCRIGGSGLDPLHDQPLGLNFDEPQPVRFNAAQLRLAMARATLGLAGGTVRLQAQPDGTTLELLLPAQPAAIDVAEPPG
ncbi:MAG: sensor histidine kinase [Longimicrobiales bacterium]